MKKLSPELLEEIVKRLVESLHPEKIILFGSHAYGNPVETSDIDLLVVVSESGQPRYRRERKAYGCLWGLTAPVELVVVTKRELEEMTQVPASLGYQAFHRGKILYERSQNKGNQAVARKEST